MPNTSVLPLIRLMMMSFTGRMDSGMEMEWTNGMELGPEWNGWIEGNGME